MNGTTDGRSDFFCREGRPQRFHSFLIEQPVPKRIKGMQDDPVVKRWRNFGERVLLSAQGEIEKEQIKRRIKEIDRLLGQDDKASERKDEEKAE